MLLEEKGKSQTIRCYPPDTPRTLPCTMVTTEPSAIRKRAGKQGYRSRFLTVEFFARTASGEQGRTPLGTSLHEELGGVDQ